MHLYLFIRIVILIMQELFWGYYKPTEEEFKKLWNKGVFVFDTNILLNLYRYSEKTRERLFEILYLLKDRIWIPHQVAYEYQEGRLNTISEQSDPYEEIQKILDEYLENLNKLVNRYSKRHSFTSFVEENKIISTATRANKRISKTLKEKIKQDPNLIEEDIHRDKIDNLFSGKIGNPYDEEEVQKIYKQVKSRFEKEIPPGYKDKKKPSYRKQYGDAIIWFQLIDYAKTQNKPIIFVTDDAKEDWWKIHKGKTISPRPELIQEMKSEANVNFWMYTGDRFLMYAEEYLKLLEEPEVIEEAKEIRVDRDLQFNFPGIEKLAQSISTYRDEQILMNDEALIESIERLTERVKTMGNNYPKKIAKMTQLLKDLQVNNDVIIAREKKEKE